MFELANPWFLVCLPLPLLLWFFMPRAAMHLPIALKVPFYAAMLSIVDKKNPGLIGKSQISLLFLIWCLLVLAAAGPRWIGEPESLTRDGRNILLALDLSGSMEINDMEINGRPVSRLEVVKVAAKQFVQERIGDRIGLILFGSRAYLQTPLTYDHHNVLLRLEDATVGLAGQTTSIGDAIGLAVKRLQDVPARGRLIILLTDGANNSGILSPLKAAELAKLDDIKIYTIGLGADEVHSMGGFLFGPNSAADLDEETLQKVAKITGGRYFRATDKQSLHSIYNTINQLETVNQDAATIRPQHDYYPWPLAFALLLFLIWLAQKAGLSSRFTRQQVEQ